MPHQLQTANDHRGTTLTHHEPCDNQAIKRDRRRFNRAGRRGNKVTTTNTTKKTKISEGYLVRENVKSLSNSVTKFFDQEICEEFHFFRH